MKSNVKMMATILAGGFAFFAGGAPTSASEAPIVRLQAGELTPQPCQVGTLDPSPSSPPDNTDDPGTTDPGCWEINHTFSLDRSTVGPGGHNSFTDTALDINYGWNENLQLKLVLHYNTSRGTPETYPNGENQIGGMGRIEVGAKQRIYKDEKNNLEISWFPTIDFVAPGSPTISNGVPDTGTNITLPILVSKRYGPVVLVSNAGVIVSLNDPKKRPQILMSLAAGISLSDSTTANAEIYRTSSANFRSEALTTLTFGLTTKVSENTVLYASLGRSIGSTADGHTHIYALAGFKVLFGHGSKSVDETTPTADSDELRYHFKNLGEMN